MTLPEVFPIFPLDEVILVPGQMLPLHIFEPRYRDMVADVLGRDRAFAMAVSENGSATGAGKNPPVRPVCGLGKIVHHQPYPGGRADIIVEGLARMRIEEELATDKPYRVVRARRFEEVEPEDDRTDRVRKLLERVKGLDDAEREAVAELPLSPLLDCLLIRVPAPMPVKHDIFGAARLADRLEGLEAALDRLDEPPSPVCFVPSDPRLN